ncbi:MAG: sulfatase-like hydrolase/transferase [Verrucomicrobia bacterium]|nr:sulfatase-like hydrolase/transferase [Verrucomicrobiota bacterium]
MKALGRLIISLLLAAFFLTPGCARKQPQTNLIIITLDTTRADRLGCYGYEKALTPALDSLAQNGVLFEQAYTSVPLTLPSHATMFTGLYPPEHGLRTNGKRSLHSDIPTLAEILTARGYRSSAFVASSVLSSLYGLQRGFEYYDDISELESEEGSFHAHALTEDPQFNPYRMGNEVVSSALEWLEEHVGSGDDGPFFCWIHLYDTHLPGHWHKDLFGDRFGHQYDAELAFVDRQIGRLLEFLHANDLTDHTLIVAVGDHGEGLSDNGEESHGFFLYSTLHVPMIFSWPTGVDSGSRIDSQINIADLLPSVLETLDIDPRVYARGDPRNSDMKNMLARSFASALHGGSGIESRSFYAETDLPFVNFRWAPLRGYVTPEWKYIRAPRPELYDRQKDPADLNNLAARMPEKSAEFDGILLEVEQSFHQHEAISVELSDDDKRRLESLGYMAGGSGDYGDADYQGLPDVKDMKELIDLQASVRTRIQHGQIDTTTEKMCEKVVSLSPSTSVFHSWLGIIKGRLNKPEEAMTSFEEALRLAPDGITIHNNLGIVLTEAGRSREAIKHFEEALAIKPSDERVRHNLARAYGEFGFELGQSGQFTGAVDILEKSIALKPEDPVVHHNLALAHFSAGEPDKAINEFREAIRLDPDYDLAKRNLSIVLDALRREQPSEK